MGLAFDTLDAPPSRTAPIGALATREIDICDHDAVAAFLGAGIGYPKAYFDGLLGILRAKESPTGYPRYGYLMQCGPRIVGAIILIFTAMRRDGQTRIRCHVTSWCVDKKYRPLGTGFFARGINRPEVDYLNISARPAIAPIVEAQGFARYASGQFVFAPLANALRAGVPGGARILPWQSEPDAAFAAFERELLIDHARYGCLSFWCVEGGRAYPFVFHERRFKDAIPGVQLIYCQDVETLARLAGPISRHLARRGKFVASIDANGPVAGLSGKFFLGVEPRYFKGAQPRLGDLAYTQKAMRPFVKHAFPE